MTFGGIVILHSLNLPLREGNRMKCIRDLIFFYINYALVSDVSKIEHLPAFKSDHNPVRLILEINKDSKRGPGFWKLNESVLEHKENLDKINIRVQATIEKADKEKYSKTYKWEKVKEALVLECKEISRTRARKINENFNYLQAKLESLHQHLTDAQIKTNTEKENIEDELEKCKTELSRYLEYKANGARACSRSKWYEFGELPTNIS